jgi:large subunit ribosomal protein L31e
LSERGSETERVYTVQLSRAWVSPRYRRTVRAINILKEFAERHMKSSEIRIESDLNETLWMRGITHPPRKIKVKMSKDEDGLVTISLPKLEEEEVEVEPTKDESQKIEEKSSSQAEKATSETQEKGKSDEAVVSQLGEMKSAGQSDKNETSDSIGEGQRTKKTASKKRKST